MSSSRRWVPLLAAALVACGSNANTPASSTGGGPSGTGGDGGTAGGGAHTEGDPNDLAFPAVEAVNNGRFASSPVCAECHSASDQSNAMRDETDATIGYFELWSASMMANASRDPLWRAVVSAEVAATPSRASDIQQKCMSCHAPMAVTDAKLTGTTAPWDAMLADDEQAHLARDGVSCALCHQIEPDGLGTEPSFGAGFVIEGDGTIYGPHDNPFSMPMENRSGFSPTPSQHIGDANLCATCHTLETNAFTPEGDAAGFTLPEQMPYLEWRNSSFNDEVAQPAAEAKSCQGCHVPQTSEAGVPLSTAIARNPMGGDFGPVGDRSPVGRHVFLGGNAFMLQILRDWAPVLQPLANTAAFDQAIAQTKAQLAERTATLTTTATRSGDEVEVTVTLANLTGHKFPTGHPARRAWLWLEAKQGDQVVFQSGAFDARGRLVDGGGQILESESRGGGSHPHHDTIDDAAQAYVLESVMADPDGKPTYALLRGATYLKDNRLLPRGWRSDHQDVARIAPVGTSGDASFAAGGDVVTYRFSAPAGAVTITARLQYQSLSPRYADELFGWDTPEVRAFRVMYEGADHTPELVGEASVTVD